jgi:hypothetical protein
MMAHMNDATTTDWTVVLGYAAGVGLAFVGAVGVWLQYSQSWLNGPTAGLLSFAVGVLIGGAWAYLRRMRLD